MRLFITTDSSQLYKYLFKIKRTIFDECDFHTLCRWSSSLWLCMAPFLNLLLGLARTRFTWIQNGAIFFSFQVFLMISKFFGDVFVRCSKSWFGAKFHNTRGRCPFFLDPSRPRKWRIFRRWRQSKHFQKWSRGSWNLSLQFSFLFSWFERRTS